MKAAAPMKKAPPFGKTPAAKGKTPMPADKKAGMPMPKAAKRK